MPSGESFWKTMETEVKKQASNGDLPNEHEYDCERLIEKVRAKRGIVKDRHGRYYGRYGGLYHHELYRDRGERSYFIGGSPMNQEEQRERAKTRKHLAERKVTNLLLFIER